MITTYIVLGIIALFFILASIAGKEMKIEKSITINLPKQQVFDFVKYVKNHDQFNVWAMMDPDMKREYRGTDGTVGFVFAWDSSKKKNVGAGEQEIKKIEDSSIEHEIRFIRPMQNVAKGIFTFQSISDKQTEVKWGFYGQMKFPMNLLKSIFEKGLGKNLEIGLFKLKTVLEKQ